MQVHFDSQGFLWVTTSTGQSPAYLYKFDPTTGTELGKYPMPIGIEGISFDVQGRLWAASESGSIKYQNAWPNHYFPVIFGMDVSKLTICGMAIC